MIAAMGELDAAISTASFRAGRHDWTRPSFRQPGAPAELTDVRHPLLLDAVPNSVSLAPGRGVLITGSNMSGKSTFSGTVGVTAVLAQTSAPHLFLLDELFRGTNAVERIAAGQAVLLELVSDSSRPNLHVVLAATHDGELVDLLPKSYSAFHFGDTVGPDGLIFDRQLRPGPATTRNAIALLRLHGASQDLIRSALECAAVLDAQRGRTLQGR